MKRFWLVVGVLGVTNLLAAAALAWWMPVSTIADPTPSSRVIPRPYFAVPSRPERFERRVRAIEAALGLEPSGPVRSLTFFSPPRWSSLERSTDSRGARSRRDDEASVASDQDAAPEQDRRTAAILTPFGMYRSGFVGVGLALLSLCTLLSAGGLTLYLQPRRMRILRDALRAPWYRTLHFGLIGLLGYFLSLLVLFILVTLVTGVLFGVLLLLLLTSVTFLGLVAVSLSLGLWLKHRLALPASSPLADMSLGMLLLFPLGLIPLLGWVLVFAAASVGFGAILLTKFGSEKGWSLDAFQEGEDAHLA